MHSGRHLLVLGKHWGRSPAGFVAGETTSCLSPQALTGQIAPWPDLYHFGLGFCGDLALPFWLSTKGLARELEPLSISVCETLLTLETGCLGMSHIVCIVGTSHRDDVMDTICGVKGQCRVVIRSAWAVGTSYRSRVDCLGTIPGGAMVGIIHARLDSLDCLAFSRSHPTSAGEMNCPGSLLMTSLNLAQHG